MDRRVPTILSGLLLAAAFGAGCDGDGTTVAATAPAAMPVHEGAARGEAHGLPFELDRAELQQGGILILHGEDGRAFFVFLFLDEGESAAGQRFSINAAENGDPHVHMHYRTEGGLEIDTFMDDYALELEFDDPARGRLAGRIDLRLPDEAGSFVSGSFEAELPG